MLRANAPVVGLAVVQGVIFVLQNRGWLTPDQALFLMLMIGTSGAAWTHRMERPGRASLSVPPVAIILLLSLPLGPFGCAGTLEEARVAGANDHRLGAARSSADRCADLSDAHDSWILVSTIGGGIGTAGALAPVHEGIRGDDVGRWISLGTAAGGALLAAIGARMSSLKATAHARECPST